MALLVIHFLESYFKMLYLGKIQGLSINFCEFFPLVEQPRQLFLTLIILLNKLV